MPALVATSMRARAKSAFDPSALDFYFTESSSRHGPRSVALLENAWHQNRLALARQAQWSLRVLPVGVIGRQRRRDRRVDGLRAPAAARLPRWWSSIAQNRNVMRPPACKTCCNRAGYAFSALGGEPVQPTERGHVACRTRHGRLRRKASITGERRWICSTATSLTMRWWCCGHLRYCLAYCKAARTPPFSWCLRSRAMY